MSPLASIGEIAIAIQSAKGSAAASSSFRFPITGPLPTAMKDPVPETTVQTKRIPAGAWTPAAHGAGALAALARPRMIGALLYGALGAKSVSGASDPWTHTLTQGATLPWLTIWRHYAGILNERFVDARISKLTLSSRSGQPVSVVAEILAGSPRYRTAQETTATLEQTQGFEHRHGTAALLFEGAALRSISDWTLTIANGLVIEQTLAGPVPRMNGLAQISLSVAYRPADAALWRRVVYGSTSPANDALASTTPLELGGSPAGVQFTLTVATSPERSLRVAIPRLTVDVPTVQANLRGGPVRDTIELTALDPGGATSPITVTLKNGQSSY